ILVTRVGGMACAFPIEHVVETMRALPIEPLGASPDSSLQIVDGVAMIRGGPVPVVDARRLLGAPAAPAARVVVVRGGQRRIALVVDAVIDVRRIAHDSVSQLPPLLGARDWVSAIGALDQELLVVLDSARVLTDDTWRALETGGGR